MSEPPENGRRVVLVADDDADIRTLMALGLRAADVDVVVAEDGRDALRLAHERRPDLAVLDISMPYLSGLEVLQELRRDGVLAALPVLLLTARAQESDVARGLAAGADDYMTKPFSPRELRARVEALLERGGRS